MSPNEKPAFPGVLCIKVLAKISCVSLHDAPHFPAIFITERKTKSFTLEIPGKFGNVCSASKPKGFFELFPFDISSSHRVYDFRKTCLPHHQECYENTLGLDTQYNQCFTDIVLLCFINCSFLPVFSLYIQGRSRLSRQN